MEPMKHDFDGIKELDNFLPRWWLGLFYFTIAFGAVYFLYYEVFSGPSSHEELQADLEVIRQAQSAQPGGPKGPSASELNAFLAQPEKLEAGKGVYKTRCVACHGISGEGGIGPNLADAYWINKKGEIDSIYGIVKEGIAAKGMPPWGPLLTNDELASVTVYVKSLKGTSPQNPKAPQGELVKA